MSECRLGSDVDDAAAALLQHCRNRGSRQREPGVEVHRQHPLQDASLHFPEFLSAVVAADGIDEGVQTTVRLDYAIDQCARRRIVGDVRPMP